MKKQLNNKKIKIIFGLILLIMLNIASIPSFHAPMKKNNSELHELRSSGVSYDIEINDLPGSLTNWSWATTQPWFGGGSGTELAPYIIEDETFMYSSGAGECLRIFNSRKYFIVRNCTIVNSHPALAGLHLNNVTNGQIFDNDIVFNGYGIVYIDVNNTLISNNDISIYSDYGVWLLEDCDNNIINGNTVNGNGGDYGVVLDTDNDNNLIYENYVTNHAITNAIDDGANNDWNNTVIGNYWDDYTGYDMDVDGIGDDPYSITGSAGNFDYLPIWDLQGPIAINDLPGSLNNWTWAASQAWCSGSGTELDPYVIENLNIDANFTDSCISISNSEAHFIIQDCSLNNSATVNGGIYLNNVTNGDIIGNSLNNFTHGIEILGSSNEVLDNTLYGDVSGTAIYIHGGVSENIINNNIIENSYNGIWIDGANNNTISGNEIYNNSADGMVIFTDFNFLSENIVVNNGLRGIYLIWSNENTIENTLIAGNKQQGIIVEDSDDNIIYDNEIRNNIITGVSISGSSDGNLMYQNYFINNTDNAVDNGANNEWNNTLIGNYWDDYTGYDMDLDGIGDDPYSITGSAGNFDYLPIWHLQSPIAIDDLPSSLTNWSWAETQPWFGGGSGTELDPYIIEELTIDGKSIDSCIAVLNSNKDFIIRNCKVYNSGTGMFESGILLFNVTNSQIIGNNASNNNQGISLIDSDYSTVSGNTVNQNALFGITLAVSHNNTVSGNTANENLATGIFLTNSNDNIISENTVNINNQYGIHLDSSSFNTFSENTASDNPASNYYLFNSHNNTLHMNIADKTSSYGIFLDTSHFNVISECEVYNISSRGIYLFDSNDNIISKNIVMYNFWGLFAEFSNDNTFYKNNFNNNTQIGIAVENSYNNKILENTANFNTNLWGGIMVSISVDTLVQGNIVIGNNPRGIGIIFGSDNNNATGNIIKDNTLGMEIEPGADNNLMYENFFLKNGIHAVDNGLNNDWNSTTIGNYWDNHTGPDLSPVDGIVDTLYTYIGGSAGSIDYLPIAEDGPPSIIINSPSEDDIFGTSAPSFSVTITDDFLDETWYTLDGGLHNYTFTGSTGTLDQTAWDAMPDGLITLTFYASDLPGNLGFAKVNIEKDGQAPLIVISSPITDDTFGATAPSFIVEISDNNLDSMWYSLDGGTTNFVFIANGTINQTAWSALAEGSVTITFYANDTLGNLESESVDVVKSLPPPDDNFVVIIIIVISIVAGVAIVTVVVLLRRRKA